MKESEYPKNVYLDVGVNPDEEHYYDKSQVMWLERYTKFCDSRYRIYKYYYMDHLPVSEIAANMGMREGHVRRELSKIRHTLRKNRMMFSPDWTDYERFRDRFRGKWLYFDVLVNEDDYLFPNELLKDSHEIINYSDYQFEEELEFDISELYLSEE